MNPIAYALYKELRQQPEEVNITMEELTSKLRASKTKVRQAFVELEAEGLLSYTREG